MPKRHQPARVNVIDRIIARILISINPARLPNRIPGEPAAVVEVEEAVADQFQARWAVGAVAPLGAEVRVGLDRSADGVLGADSAFAVGEVADPVVDGAVGENMLDGVALHVVGVEAYRTK